MELIVEQSPIRCRGRRSHQLIIRKQTHRRIAPRQPIKLKLLLVETSYKIRSLSSIILISKPLLPCLQ
jgi:hypothetical protein